MKTWLFRTCNSESASHCRMDREWAVEARTEAEARRLAMETRWGPPRGIYAPAYKGAGLHLISVSS